MTATRGLSLWILVLSMGSGCGAATSLSGAAGTSGGNTGEAAASGAVGTAGATGVAGMGGMAATGGASGDMGSAGTGGAPVDAGDPSNADGASDATEDAAASACTWHEAVAPVSTVAAYTTWSWSTVNTMSQPICSDEALMHRLLSCDAVAVSTIFGLGSHVLRVVERRADTCRLEYWSDVEGGDDYWTCEVPLPLAPWAGLQVPYYLPGISKDPLEGIRDKCTRVGTCCIAFCGAGSSCDPTYVPPPRP
jgi:hypothetical protein